MGDRRDCGYTDVIIDCGATSQAELLQKYDSNNDGRGNRDIQAIFNHYGITRSDIAGNQVKKGWLALDGSITVDGKVVATGAQSLYRVDPGKQVSPVTIAGKTYYIGPVANNYRLGADVFVFYRDGVFHAAIQSSCGNPIIATPKPVPPKPVFTCDSLQATKIDRTNFKFTATATGKNGAALKHFVFDFGDGKTKTQVSNVVEHTFSKPGTYTVKVTANFLVDGERKDVTNKNCEVKVVVEKEQTFACEKLEFAKISRTKFKFTPTASAANGATITRYSYDFGDGKTANSATNTPVEHTYAQPGTYTVKLSVDATVNGATQTKTSDNCKVTITVEEEKVPVTTCVSLVANKISRTKFDFTASATAENAEVVNFTYNFGDGATVTDDSTVSHEYAQPGTYTATVTANFRVNGEIVSKTSPSCKVTVTVEKEPVFTCNSLKATKISRTKFSFTSDATAANGATVVDYSYNFGDGSTARGGKTIEHTYAQPGTYTATVTVNFTVNGKPESRSGDNCKVTVTVEKAPVYSCKSLTKQQISRNKFSFTSDAVAENGAQVTGYSYDFGDGVKTNGGKTIEHTYAQPGTYTATVTVNFSVEGRTESNTGPNCKVTITVEEEQIPVYKCESLTAQKISRDKYRFTATASAVNAQLNGYTFNFGDGSNNVATAERTVEHTYAQPGTYTAKVTAHFTVNGEAKSDTNQNCEVTVKIEQEDKPSIDIVKTVNGKEHIKIGVGVEFTYEITVRNTGNVVLKDAVVTDKAPSQVTLISAAQGTIANNEWTYTIPELKVGESKSFTIKAKYAQYAAGTHKNTVCVDTPTVPGSPDDCDDATTETNELIEVCDLTDNTVKKIERSEFDESHMTTDLRKCGNIEVCIIKDKVVKVIAKSEYDESTMTTDLTKCVTTETPPELPKTGLDMFISGGLGLGSITAAGYYWTASRKNLLNALLNRK
jgi:uncharacterized repeat protein (TIGR01451 family)